MICLFDVRPGRVSLWLAALRLGLAVAKAWLGASTEVRGAMRGVRNCTTARSCADCTRWREGRRARLRGRLRRYAIGDRSGTSLSLSAMWQSSASDAILIFRMMLLRCTFTVASAMPMSPAICLLRRPCAT